MPYTTRTLSETSSLNAARDARGTVGALTLAWSNGLARAGEQILLPAGTRATLGRTTDTFPVGPLDDRGMSRAHVEFAAHPSGCRLRDLGSKNGTFVGAVRVESHDLVLGDVVRVGRTLLVYHLMPALSDPSVAPLLVGPGGAMSELRDRLAQVGAGDLSVLLLGETGTGKEVVARTLHDIANREGRFVAVNCAALRPELLESELFGHTRGAFTGAQSAKEGMFQLADGGTIFLDEVGEMPVELQPRLLRALQERRVRPVGGAEERPVDVRVVSATNRDLLGATRHGRFRADLFARLAQCTLALAPLRERREDIGALTRHFAEGAEVKMALMEALLLHPWPLNVRGLQNIVRLARLGQTDAGELDLTATTRDALDTQAQLAAPPEPAAPGVQPANTPSPELDRAALTELMRANGGSVAAVARAAGMSRQALYRRLERAGLSIEDFRE